MSDDLEALKIQEMKAAQEELLKQAMEVGSICLWCKNAMLMQIDVPDPRIGNQPGIVGVPRIAALQTVCLKGGSMPMNPISAVRACGGWVFGETSMNCPTIKLESGAAPKFTIQ